MKNERMVTRKLFISCILILCIIFTTIIILQKEHYEKIIEENNKKIKYNRNRWCYLIKQVENREKIIFIVFKK